MTPDSANVKTVAAFRPMPASRSAAQPSEDPTFEFASETKPADVTQPFPVVLKVPKPAVLAVAATLLVLVVAGAVLAALTLRTPITTTGSLNIETDPPGAEVRIDDIVRGTTPLALTLPEGHHRVVVRRGSHAKQLDVEVAGGAAKAYHIEWPQSVAAPAVATGSLSVVSDPPGSSVIVDGTQRGQTPLTIRELSAGRHDVLVRNSSNTYQRSVQVDAGATASLVVGGAPAQAASWGWITMSAPFPVQVLENGRVVGTSEIDRILLSPGNHELDLISDQFGFRQSSKVNILSGRGAPVSLTIPRVAMNINALPWAEVFVDGTRIGDTPLANVEQPIGDHEIVFRHPQLGEKRQMTRVTVQDSLRISMDMRTR